MNLDEILPYNEVLNQTAQGTCHLLLGNGFSIACDPIFSYGSLYDRAVTRGLSPRAQQLFARLGTNNFEAVMRLLADGHWLCGIYAVDEIARTEIQADLQVVKETLVAVVAESHPSHTGLIPDERKVAAARFFEPYANVFSLNYDLLPYWTNMAAAPRPPFEDGFRADPNNPDGQTLLFCEPPGRKPGILFPHGALHIFASRAGIRKHSWSRTGEALTGLIRRGLEENNFPLFVAEGTADNKRSQILNNSYLAYCFGKLGRIQAPLVTFGWSFGPSDRHIVDTIALNQKLRRLYVGLLGRPRDLGNQSLIQNLEYLLDQRRLIRGYDENRDSLDIFFYDAISAQPWGAVQL